MVSTLKCRVGAPQSQRNSAANRGFALKQQKQVNVAVPRQKPQTLDSLFANMKEQRQRVFSSQNNNNFQQLRQPRGRGRFAN